MILLSRLIKSQFTNKNEQNKQPISVVAIRELLQEKYKNEDYQDPVTAEKSSFIIQSAKEEAEQMILAARMQQENLYKQIEEERNLWETEKAQLFEQTRQEGYAEGLELGRREALHKYESFIQESQKIIDMAKEEYDEKIQSSENVILEIAIKVAEKIISSKLKDSAENFLSLVKQGLHEVKEYENIKIHIHPSNYDYLLSQKEELKQIVTNETDLNMYANAELNENDCYIESSFGRIDISVDTQLEQLKQQLIQLLEGNER